MAWTVELSDARSWDWEVMWSDMERSHISLSSLKSVRSVAQDKAEEVGICVQSVQPIIVMLGEMSTRVRFRK